MTKLYFESDENGNITTVEIPDPSPIGIRSTEIHTHNVTTGSTATDGSQWLIDDDGDLFIKNNENSKKLTIQLTDSNGDKKTQIELGGGQNFFKSASAADSFKIMSDGTTEFFEHMYLTGNLYNGNGDAQHNNLQLGGDLTFSTNGKAIKLNGEKVLYYDTVNNRSLLKTDHIEVSDQSIVVDYGGGDKKKLHFWHDTEDSKVNTHHKVGIGVTAPEYELDVAGNIRMVYSDSNQSTGIRVLNNGMVNTSFMWNEFGKDGSSCGLLGYRYHDSDDGQKIFLGYPGNGTEFTLVKGGGKVGIGNSSPSYKLDVAGDINLTGSLRINGTEQSFGVWTVSNDEAYYTDGYVGIGTTDPEFPLHIHTSQATTANDARFFDSAYIGYVLNDTSADDDWGGDEDDGDYGPARLNVYDWDGSQYPVSLYAEYMVFSNTYCSASDERIKTNITPTTENKSLEIINKIKSFDYKYRDTHMRGEKSTTGFIAQQVKSVYPQAVQTTTKSIPNYYRFCKTTEKIWSDNKLTLSFIPVENNIKKMKFIVSDFSTKKEKHFTLSPEGNTFTFDKKYDVVFIYGEVIEDFHVLNKQKIFSLYHSAIQELSQKIKVLEEKINSQ